ncbi:hypothetical protein HWV62_3188 [Athelia sp. TMB]|nr:hypothetical protein HWV62_3188 [Athelia sp. TMB]
MVTLLKDGEFVGSLDCGTTSIRFIIFDRYANIIAQHQAEFPQYYPEPGWHEHDADEIQQVSEQCIAGATKDLENKGWSKESVKIIGITNQRETTVAWSRTTGKPLYKAIVWTDSRTKNHVAHFEKKLRDHGLYGQKGDAGVNKLREM